VNTAALKGTYCARAQVLRTERLIVSVEMRQGEQVTDAEVIAHLRAWKPSGAFAWATDACGYEQHIRFVIWRNERRRAGDDVDVLVYADLLEAGKIPPFKQFDFDEDSL
jgi:hypothetical protein